MSDDFGISFSPLQNQTGKTGGVAGGGSVSPVQDAIRVLSLRIPQVVGAKSLAPGPLLNGAGAAGAGMPGASMAQPNIGLDEWLRRLLAQGGSQRSTQPIGGAMVGDPYEASMGTGGPQGGPSATPDKPIFAPGGGTENPGTPGEGAQHVQEVSQTAPAAPKPLPQYFLDRKYDINSAGGGL